MTRQLYNIDCRLYYRRRLSMYRVERRRMREEKLACKPFVAGHFCLKIQLSIMISAFQSRGRFLFVLNVEYDNRQFAADTPEQSALLQAALEEIHPEYHFITHKDIENGINEFAETHNLDLIIAIPKKHKLLDGLFKKSSTRQLVFESHVPVMCVHE